MALDAFSSHMQGAGCAVAAALAVSPDWPVARDKESLKEENLLLTDQSIKKDLC
ncbi:hypothetical protein KTQ42_04900|uniref:hypothetical protein n=1 Tax=Noviherbaspirillum sp. L7-7A TaxID=2850560 RepID=UPI001C2BB993|nr:hypothetical protein [Noviherbaspirillum sp. L7-7A]MBV0878639.1 hypothetical protein [Noviherbaspirillum sp. L7-7A]